MDRREFLEALAIGAAAGLPIGRAARSPPKQRAFYDIPRFGNVSLLHMTDCHAQLLPVHFREPSVNLGIGPAAGRPPHLVGDQFLKAYGIRARTPGPRVHPPRFRARGAHLRQDGRLRAPRDAGEAPQGVAPRRAAARRRRHLAGLGDVAVDQGPGHDRRAEAARRGHHDRPLGVHLRPGAREAGRRERLQGPHRIPRAERQDRRLRRPGVQALRDARDQRRARSASSARRFPTRRSPTRATSSPTGPSASRKASCRSRSTRCAPRARASWCCFRTTAWTWT